jgi:peptidoglycan/xylan/chitin deacetylase (PgdA/CDA1 family)
MHLWSLLLSGLLLAGCGLFNPAAPEYGLVPLSPFRYAVQEDEHPLFELEVLKWPEGRRAAVSITYDAPFGTHPDHHLATDAVLSRGLTMDIEMVTAIYATPENRGLLENIRNELLPRGIHFFGHGHRHINHDSLSYEENLAEFQLCFDLMTRWGLRPRAYAYPGSAGRLAQTQLANRNAGFLCARGMSVDPAQFSICPDSTTVPANWFYLPSVVLAQDESINYVNNHQELEPILAEALERRAWVVLMYHAVGIPEGWGYYPLVDFEKDLDYLAGHDFWSANMDMAALYIKERNAFVPQLRQAQETKGQRSFALTLGDGLDNEVYDQLLTLEFRFGERLKGQTLHVEPALEGQADFPVSEGIARLRALPDEQTYLLSLR